MLFRNVALVSLALVAAASAADTNPTSDHVASLLARRRLSKEKVNNKATNLANDEGRFLQEMVALDGIGCPVTGLCPLQGWCDDKGKNKKCDKWAKDAKEKGKLTSCPKPGQKCVKPGKDQASAPADDTTATSAIKALLDKNVLGYGDLTLTGTIGNGDNISGTVTGVQLIEPSRETDGNGAASGGATDGAGNTGDGNNNGAANGGATDGGGCADPKVLSLAAKGESIVGTDKKCDQDCDCEDGCCAISAFGSFCTPQSADDSTRSQYGYPQFSCTPSPNQ